ncbi:MAG TPA: class I SAM-dependent methyltransferase [Candidatus Dormibacteraeota bacterium]
MSLRARIRIGRLVEGRVLEIGVGTGLNLTHYPAGTDVTGIDLSPKMLEIARRRAADLDLKVDLREMDAEALDLPNQSFDSIVYSLCLCTIPDPVRAIKEGIRVARPAARMIFFEHVRSNLLPVALLQELINPLTVRFMADHWNRRTVDTIRAAGIEPDYLRRAWLGMFVLAAGRAPQPSNS